MMGKKLIILFMAAAVSAFTACNNAAPKAVTSNTATTTNLGTVGDPHADPGHDAPRISLADAKKAYDDGALIVDVRDAAAYKQEHVKGALNIQLTDMAATMDKLPKGKKIIVYCS